jgi:putative methionine-R-sulfoxide reductase with GAF domain
VVAVLDIDALDFDVFSEADVAALRPLTSAIEELWQHWEA